MIDDNGDLLCDECGAWCEESEVVTIDVSRDDEYYPVLRRYCGGCYE